MCFSKKACSTFALTIMMLALLTGCATGKSIKGAEDITDDGKRNIVLLTYDTNVYVRNRHNSVDSTNLILRCPQNKAGFGGTCFDLKLPFLGSKVVDGFGLDAFEKSGAKAVKMKYGSYTIQSAQYGIVTERVPKTTCYFDKKKKKDICNTRTENKRDNHSARLPNPISINVTSGSGCYLGHLQITMADSEIREYNLDRNAELTDERLNALPADVADSLVRFVDRPC